MKIDVMGPLQRLGKALMGAVAVLPVAAILSGVGYWISSAAGPDNLAAQLLISSGDAVLANLGWIFAIAIAFGLAKDSNGAAALSGFLAFATFMKLLGPEAVAGYRGIEDPTALTGDEALEWASEGWNAVGGGNVLFGILAGVMAAWVYNRFHGTKLPDFLAFFSGRRLVPILTAVIAIVISGILYFVWPFIYNALFNFGTSIQGLGAAGAGIYGVANRLLIPTGLHHALNSVFWFDVIGINDIGNFQAGQKTIEAAAAATSAADCPGIWANGQCTVEGVVGRYQAGFFPVMMFGLPGAALAMYLRADKSKRKVVGSLMAAGALASFFTGVTEPLEFSFMFVAPLLYVVHALLMGLSVFIASTMEWTAGFGFSAGFVDMLLSSQNPLANKWYMLLVMGVGFFALYFVIFYFLIGWLNLKTPGRGEDDAVADPMEDSATGDDKTARDAARIIEGLGGKDNIDSLDYCTTRLRVGVKERALVDDSVIKRAAISGVIHPSEKSVQVIVGPAVQFMYDEVSHQLRHGSPVLATAGAASAAGAGASAASAQRVSGNTAGGDAVDVDVRAPFAGDVVALSQVPDASFAQGMVGEGFAVMPDAVDAFDVCAPVDGTITMVFKTRHAFGMKTADGLDLLIHIGIDTVELKGEGFTALAKKGDTVTAGTPIIAVEAQKLRERGVNLITPVVCPTAKQVAGVDIAREGHTQPGEVAATVKCSS
ncbi:PTS N-acetylmuramic acid transporter subunit IIBC [Corynebacterium sp. HMSC062E11]|uniref:N-acetylglucosamine-specific PTS transporter subunit IIBC n=1 Tax=unclassified Corynebacterium TaxID=2624378 RepID=UPI0008A3AE07|nr:MULTISPECIES: N-acetylglucosamine-specific PTS transporter subunit IIBC [unclassified Corynebacterium]MDK6806741.1 N-acetylglucosamine-specific PTS transporter subunit IIBC [Corynebacterium aurimucosum]MDK8896800.1 N-acetylglucosamine-specific PTS transporter subunit IIBC [Corynebacterium sp. MSK004]NJJ82014.1 PTS transporter subunit EIIC [Corynebacterium aurimucosum]OFK29435.1 PTS N-acetylmuramic acid transporter subunit IIBC [Corynebacterium sp. HMSC062E11]OFP71852.1 PTS N-acetylmuramic a